MTKEIPISVLEEILRSEYISVTQKGEEARTKAEVTYAFSKQVGIRRIARRIEEYSGMRLKIDSPIPPETTRQEP